MARSSPVSSPRFLLLFSLFSLFFATVTALNLSRCGVDTACFIDKCDGDDFRADMRMHKNSEYLLDGTKCRTVLQIKALTDKRHVIFLRISGHKIANSINIVIGPITIELSARRIERRRFGSELYDIRIEATSNMNKFDKMPHPDIIVEFRDESATLVHSGVSGMKAMRGIRKSKTCTTNGISDIGDLSKNGYEVVPVDFSDLRLNCRAGYVLSAAQNKEAPTAIPELVCENNHWQTAYFNISDNGILRDFIVNAKSLRDDMGDDKWTFTMTDKTEIGCVRRGCSRCSTPPASVYACRNCTAPIVINPENPLSCAELKCPNDHYFTFNGIEGENITPTCQKKGRLTQWWIGRKMLIFLSCLYKPKVVNQDKTADKEEFDIESPIIQKPHGSHKNSTRKAKEEPAKENNAGDWLRKNWISSILTPLIIIAVIGGCIVFLVFVLRTKDEQDEMLREQRWRDRERREQNSSGRLVDGPTPSSVSARSEEALV